MKRLCFFIVVAALISLGRLAAQTTPPVNVLITLTGENFTPQSTVFIGASQFTPEFVSANILRVSIPRTMLSSAQPNNVRVTNPSAGGGASQTLPLVLACRTNNAIFASVSIVSTQYVFHQLDSVQYANLNLPQVDEDTRAMLAIMNKPVIKKTSITGSVFNDGHAELRFENLANNEPYQLPLQDQIKYSIVKTITDSVEIYNANDELLFKLHTGAQPFKPIVDKVFAIRDAILNPTQEPQESEQQQQQAALPQPPPPAEPITDSVIARSVILYEALRLGFPVQRIGSSPYYRIRLDRNVDVPNDMIATVRLAANEEIHLIYNSANDTIEEIRTFRGPAGLKPLVHRVIQKYSFVDNKRPKWDSITSLSYYDYEGLPMVFANVEVFEEFSVTLID